MLFRSTPDVFAGSYYIESLTEKYFQEINELIAKIDEMGGGHKSCGKRVDEKRNYKV